VVNWQHKLEGRTFRRGAENSQATAVVLQDLLRDSQAQAGAIFLAIADEGLKELLAD